MALFHIKTRISELFVMHKSQMDSCHNGGGKEEKLIALFRYNGTIIFL
jgi:hypothetical protein